jgi:hypothetical protein
MRNANGKRILVEGRQLRVALHKKWILAGKFPGEPRRISAFSAVNGPLSTQRPRSYAEITEKTAKFATFVQSHAGSTFTAASCGIAQLQSFVADRAAPEPFAIPAFPLQPDLLL